MKILEKFEKKKWRVYVWENPDGTWAEYCSEHWESWFSGRFGRNADLALEPCRFDASMSVSTIDMGNPIGLKEEKTGATFLVGKSDIVKLLQAIAAGFIEAKDGKLSGVWEFRKKGHDIFIVPVF